MWAERLWRYAGPVSGGAVPFVLFGAQQGIPSGTWWDEPADLAVWLTVVLCGMAVAHSVLALKRVPDEARATIQRDVEQFIRKAFGPINEHLPDIPVTRLGVHVWIARGDRLVRFVTYTMEQHRPSTPIAWAPGKGVVGVAWQKKQAIVADLVPIYAELDKLDDAALDALPADRRWGLSAEELRSGGRYKAILAYPLTDEESESVIGVLTVDCAVPVSPDALEGLLDDRSFQDVLGSCESALRRYPGR